MADAREQEEHGSAPARENEEPAGSAGAREPAGSPESRDREADAGRTREEAGEYRSKAREMFERLQDRREHHLEHGLAYRAVFMVAGFTVFGAGVAMLVLPGPALAVIPIGLAMLALEFAWAERLLEIAVDRAEAAGRTVKETSTRQRILALIAAVLLGAAAVAAAVVWDVPLLPV